MRPQLVVEPEKPEASVIEAKREEIFARPKFEIDAELDAILGTSVSGKTFFVFAYLYFSVFQQKFVKSWRN